MTPFDKAKQLLQLIVDEAAIQEVSIPDLRYAQLGDTHIVCEVVTVAVGPLSVNTSVPSDCGAVQQATFKCAIARECQWPADANGADDPAAVQEVSELITKDADVLWEMANKYHPFISKSFTVSFQIDGGMGITILDLTTAID